MSDHIRGWIYNLTSQRKVRKSVRLGPPCTPRPTVGTGSGSGMTNGVERWRRALPAPHHGYRIRVRHDEWGETMSPRPARAPPWVPDRGPARRVWESGMTSEGVRHDGGDAPARCVGGLGGTLFLFVAAVDAVYLLVEFFPLAPDVRAHAHVPVRAPYRHGGRD